MTLGWLLDLHPNGRDAARLWIREKNGRVSSHKVRWMPRLYVAGPFESLVELAKLLSPRYYVDFVERSIRPGAEPRTVLEIRVPFGGKGRLDSKRVQRAHDSSPCSGPRVSHSLLGSLSSCPGQSTCRQENGSACPADPL